MSDLDVQDFIENVETEDLEVAKQFQQEVVVDKKTGHASQAGADLVEGQYITGMRERAEQSLFVFAYGIMKRTYLTPQLHLPICNWLQKTPPYRKLLELPRLHAKTSIVSHALPPHVLIQPKESNIYRPGHLGADTRVLMVGETERKTLDNVRVVQGVFESNRLFRALWPQLCWDNPRRDSKKWNEREMIVPRETDYADPSIRGIGVGGAITGARTDVQIKDDLVGLEASNSPTVMNTAIDWHITSRAMQDKPDSLEFILGTRWAVHDIYSYIAENDPTVEIVVRSIVEDGKAIWPEAFSDARIEELQREFGVMFPLLYMNNASDPELTDFDMEMLRIYAVENDVMRFDEDERDLILHERQNAPAAVQAPSSGMPLNPQTYEALFAHRTEYLRFKR